MSPELTQAVLLCRNLPTPAGIAMRIIALAQHARETGVIPDVQPVAPVERAEQTRVLPDTPVGSR